MMNIKRIAIVLYAVVCCISCNSKIDYLVQLNNNIPDMTWIYTQPTNFSFNIADTSHPYVLGLCIRYNNDYPDANLYMFINTIFPDGNRSCDTVSVDLFMPDGTPTGNGKHIQELNVNISRIKFPQKGNYRVEIEQATRYDTIRGISSMGMYIINEYSQSYHGTEKENNPQ